MRTVASSTLPPATVAALLELLEESGRSVQVRDPSPRVRAAWRRLIHAMRSGGHIPEGWHLVHRGRDRGDLVLELRPGVHPSARYRSSPEASVPVPEDLREAHPVVDRLRNEPTRLPASPENRSRTLLLLQALATEAVSRGYTVRSGTEETLAVVAVGDDAFGVRVWEESGARWVLRLLLQVDGLGDGPVVWKDYVHRRLEVELPAVLEEMDRRARLERMTRDSARKAEQARARRRRERVVTTHRHGVLRRQIADWRLAEDIRGHCHDLVAAGMPADDPWLFWAGQYADSVDPLRDPPGIPADPDPAAPMPRSAGPQADDPPGLPVVGRPWHPNQRWYHRR